MCDDIDEPTIDDPPSDDDFDLPELVVDEMLPKQAPKRCTVDLEVQPGPSKIYKKN